MNKKIILAVIEVDEAKLKRAGFVPTQEMGVLPQVLDAAVDALTPNKALSLQGVYLLTQSQMEKAEVFLDQTATPYHTYVVEILGEVCSNEGCLEHAVRRANVIHLDAHRSRPQTTH